MSALDFPDDFPLCDFAGQVLTQVAVGRYDLQLHFHRRLKTRPDAAVFEDGGSISIRAGATLLVKGATFECTDFAAAAPSVVACPLLDLLEKPIVHVARKPDNELEVQFSGDSLLTIHVDALGFESYELRLPGIEPLVVARK